MAIQDTLLTFASATASGNTGTRAIGSIVDIQAVGATTNATAGSLLGSQRDVGQGQPVYLTISVAEDYVGTGTTDQITFQFVTSASSDLSSPVVLLSSPTFIFGGGTDVLDQGDIALQVTLPAEGNAYLRYVGIQEVVAGTTTTGKINAVLGLDPQTNSKAYAQAAVGF